MTKNYGASNKRQMMWRAFLRKMKYPEALGFDEVMAVIVAVLGPMWERIN